MYLQFIGAETGTGGRLRDVQATGRGAHTLAGISAYCVGNLHIPNYHLDWEQNLLTTNYPSNLAKPLIIEIEASNGASDYGNKYGEPVVCGFTRSFGQRLANGERYEYIKPIMFTAGLLYFIYFYFFLFHSFLFLIIRNKLNDLCKFLLNISFNFICVYFRNKRKDI